VLIPKHNSVNHANSTFHHHSQKEIQVTDISVTGSQQSKFQSMNTHSHHLSKNTIQTTTQLQ